MKDWPDFDDNGDLPPGIYHATLAEVREPVSSGYDAWLLSMERRQRWNTGNSSEMAQNEELSR